VGLLSKEPKNPSQVGSSLQLPAWFLATQKAQEKRWGKELPSLAFVHIPPSAFLKFQENVLPNVGDESGHFPGLNDDVPLDQQGNGWQDVPFMQALVDTKGMHSVYSGHDHSDAWCGNWPEGGNNTVGVSNPISASVNIPVTASMERGIGEVGT
jgi:hypothetical protein